MPAAGPKTPSTPSPLSISSSSANGPQRITGFQVGLGGGQAHKMVRLPLPQRSCATASLLPVLLSSPGLHSSWVCCQAREKRGALYWIRCLTRGVQLSRALLLLLHSPGVALALDGRERSGHGMSIDKKRDIH